MASVLSTDLSRTPAKQLMCVHFELVGELISYLDSRLLYLYWYFLKKNAG
jgi:hypothetical protein